MSRHPALPSQFVNQSLCLFDEKVLFVRSPFFHPIRMLKSRNIARKFFLSLIHHSEKGRATPESQRKRFRRKFVRNLQPGDQFMNPFTNIWSVEGEVIFEPGSSSDPVIVIYWTQPVGLHNTTFWVRYAWNDSMMIYRPSVLDQQLRSVGF